MGLTVNSTGKNIVSDFNNFVVKTQDEFLVSLAGNPNVGKSTVFNCLTGLNQHTGNWPGKTVVNAQGRFKYKGEKFLLVDVPGTYSMMSNSVEEQIARNFICFGNPDVTVVVADATCLERNLNLVLQILELTSSVVVCVNLMDEAKKKRIKIDMDSLSKSLGVPVVGVSARKKEGLNELMESVYKIACGEVETSPIKVNYDPIIEQSVKNIEEYVNADLHQNNTRWVCLKLLEGDLSIINDIKENMALNLDGNIQLKETLQKEKEWLKRNGMDEDSFRDIIVSNIVSHAENIAKKAVRYENSEYNTKDRIIDKIVMSKIFGIPIMIMLLGTIFWITIVGANYPSEILASGFSWLEEVFSRLLLSIKTPTWLHDMLALGMFRTLSWVVSVMLPPMAIFFPLFTLLEDLGYIPRVAFNLDYFFRKSCTHGKQSLTMCMGFGCNAAGVIGCRIIDSPRERLIAIITNNFVPCNGRFPILIAIATVFFFGMKGTVEGILPTIVVTGIVVLGVYMTFVISKLLSKTILKGVPSSFTLELPPYRKPQIGKIIVRSIFDRTLFVLGRAVVIAVPAGIILWIMANIHVSGLNLLSHCAAFLNPFAQIIGMDGYILMAFILGLPANEIVVPIILMSYMSAGNMLEYESLTQLGTILTSNGWTWLTALCVMIFTLMHFPCGTTLWTIQKETKDIRWTLVAFLLPTITGIVMCFAITSIARIFGLA